MTKLENTKPHSANTISTSDTNRCQRRRPSGRRCKLTVTAPGAPFCFTHTNEFNKADTLNLKTALLTGHQGFQTAQGINNSLSNLYILLANNYISPRRAAVLAFINSLQLRTLPAIDADQAAGITDPTSPDIDETEDDEIDPEDDETETEDEIEIEIEPNSSTVDTEDASANASPIQPITPSSDVSSDPAALPADSSASPCDASTSTSTIPTTPPGWLTEPDPTKKPS